MQKQVRKIMAVTFLLWFSMYTYPSFLQTYSESALGAGTMMLGLIAGSYGFTQMLLRIPLGIWSDAVHRRKPFIVAGLFASVAADFGFMLVKNAFGALVMRALTGVAGSMWVMVTVLYSANFAPEEVSSAISRLSLSQYGSQVLAMLLGPFLAQRLGESAAFALGGAAALLGVIVACTMDDLPAQKEGNAFSWIGLLQVVKNRELLAATVLSTLFHFVCWGTVLSFVTNWAKNEAALTTAQLGFLAVAYQLPNAIMCRFSGAQLAKRFGEKCVLLTGFVLTAAACFLYPAAKTAWALFAVQAVFGFGMGSILPLTVAGSIRDIPSALRGTAMGFHQSVFSVGMFVGPVLAGAVVSKMGYSANFVLNGVLALAGGALVVIFARKKDKDHASD